MPKIDDNNEYVSMAVTDDANRTPTPLKVDPATGRLMIGIKAVTSLPDTANPATKLDKNKGYVAMASDGTNPRPLLADADGNIILDIVIE